MEKRIVVLGAGESGCGAAVLAKKLGFDVFVSDFGSIADKYKAMLDAHAIAWEEVMKKHGLSFTALDCYINEGRTGSADGCQDYRGRYPGNIRNRIRGTVYKGQDGMHYRQ